jgi:dephospho-CoA kinase
VLKVGLTGGIGAGKSTVSRRLAARGAVVVDADGLAREVVEPGSEGLAAVVRAFGEDVLSRDGSLDRAALAGRAFADEDSRRTLEGLLHPLIARRTAEIFAGAPHDAVVVHDVPLLVEKDMGAGYHLVVVVDAPAEVRVRRLVRLRGMQEDAAWQRVRAQADDAERRAAADVLLDNTGAQSAVTAAVDRLWQERLVPFEANVRDGLAAPLPGVVRVVPADPWWPQQAARLAARVRRALGSAARVDHVGPTAVAGLPAEPVLDLQVVVPGDGTDVGAADSVRTALAEAAFAEVPGAAGQAAGGYGSCDPCRPARLTVRSTSDPAWQTTLALRDWLRASPAQAAELATVLTAAGGRDRCSFADRTRDWIAGAEQRAAAWAADSQHGSQQPR